MIVSILVFSSLTISLKYVVFVSLENCVSDEPWGVHADPQGSILYCLQSFKVSVCGCTL